MAIAPEDMTAALAGAVLCMIVVTVFQKAPRLARTP